MIDMKYKMKLTIWDALFHLLLIINVALSCGPVSQSNGGITLKSKNADVNVDVRKGLILLTLTKSDGTYMRNVLHTKESDESDDTFTADTSCALNAICVRNGNVTHTVVTVDSNSEIISVKRHVANPNGELIDCYEFGEDTDWFGGPQMRYQHWPIQNMYFEEEPYVPTHPVNMAITERYWLSSRGVYIYVRDEDPLFLDQNNYKERSLCLISKNKSPYRSRDVVTLEYEIGVFPNPRFAHETVMSKHFTAPNSYPNERMIEYPIWSTWARYKADVDEEVVYRFADEIIDNQFSNSQLEIDDNWETCYGSAEFDPDKFPDVPSLTQNLKEVGFRVTLWIHPFINEGCQPAYDTALSNSYFVKNLDGNVQMQWWQGEQAATIDFTNPAAVAWWVGRLKLLTKLGIDSFKFDAGEVSWLPQPASLNGPVNMQPGIFTRDYVTALTKNFDNNIEVRVGWRSQELPIFVRMIDKDTRWTLNNGLPTLITTLFQMNLNGYIYVLPDMIGGNGYLNNMLNGTFYPPKELFIRWLEANVFMPSLQYSFVPWDYDAETIAISRKFTELHAEITPIIIEVMNASKSTTAPVNAPIWWIDPTDRVAHKISDEYLLGERVLVAPVIEEGAVSRDVYLPAGIWKDGNTGNNHIGPKWIMGYPAPLDVLPYFFKI